MRVQRSKSSIFQRSDQMQGRSHTAWKQNPNITIMFHESIAILLKNAPVFEVPLSLGNVMDISGCRHYRVDQS
jgi:hypothetical protein